MERTAVGKNNIQNLVPAEAVLLANRIVAACGPGPTNTYGIVQADLTQLAANATALTTTGNAVEDALATYRAAVATRNGQLRLTRYILGNVARQVYANSALTPAKIQTLGLSPRSKSRTKTVPVTPDGLVAEPQANGTMKLSWNRSGNPSGAMFVVEARTEGGDWAPVANTSASRTVLGDLLPGGPIQLRVYAMKNDEVSLPSPLLVLYASATTPPLRIAA